LNKRLTKSLYTAEWEILLKTLKGLREQKGWTQEQIAEKLDRPQSLVAKIESGERRLDVCQFIDYMRVLEADPVAVMRQFVKTIQNPE
jgi:transcriptional regulator with XRE-family HTH domain